MWLLDVDDEETLRAYVVGGAFAEGHYLEAKRELADGAKANLELARDLASLAIDGGVLVVGADEDKATSTFSLSAVRLAGLAERVEQVADSRIAPRLTTRIRKIASSSDSAAGYLIVEVPPSPEAPHMVDGRYYGRGDTTKHVLSDADVRRLSDRRAQRRNDFEAALARDVAADPTPLDARNEAHLFILATPSAGRPEMLHAAVNQKEMTLRDWANNNILRGRTTRPLGGWPFGADFEPDLKGGLEVSTRARGVSLHTWAMGANRIPQSTTDDGPINERRLLDVEIDDDGTIHLFCAAGTTTHERQRLMLPPLVAGLTTRVVRIATEIGATVLYSGTWTLGLRLTNARGAVSSRLARNVGFHDYVEYTDDEYLAIASFVHDEMAADERAVTIRLCDRLYRGVGEPMS